MSPLHRALTGTFRLRAGDYGVFFNLEGGTMRIAAALHSSRAYR